MVTHVKIGSEERLPVCGHLGNRELLVQPAIHLGPTDKSRFFDRITLEKTNNL